MLERPGVHLPAASFCFGKTGPGAREDGARWARVRGAKAIRPGMKPGLSLYFLYFERWCGDAGCQPPASSRSPIEPAGLASGIAAIAASSLAGSILSRLAVSMSKAEALARPLNAAP